jgi:hypothetical protein
MSAILLDPRGETNGDTILAGTSNALNYEGISIEEKSTALSVERESLKSNLPPTSKVLLHSCCAPCSGSMIKELVDLGIDVTILWYNPNVS